MGRKILQCLKSWRKLKNENIENGFLRVLIILIASIVPIVPQLNWNLGYSKTS
jgi:hypothetical protein